VTVIGCYLLYFPGENSKPSNSQSEDLYRAMSSVWNFSGLVSDFSRGDEELSPQI